MTRERWFHGGEEFAAFNWQRPARDLDVPIETARALYVRAMRLAIEVQRAEMLYRRWLSDAASAPRLASVPAPVSGCQTRVLYETEGGARAAELLDLARR